SADFNLLLSLWLVFMLCTSWVSAFSSLAPPDPTPPTGSAPNGDTGTGFPGPPVAAPTEAMPQVSTEYPLYG
ncbi:hypothetical protein KR054_010794, partial [Drosophila jambulina]